MGAQIPGLDHIIETVRFYEELEKFDEALGNLEEELERLRRTGQFVMAVAQMSDAVEAEQTRIANEVSYTSPEGQLVAVRWRNTGPEAPTIVFMFKRPGDEMWNFTSPGDLGLADGEWFAGNKIGMTQAGSPHVEATTPNGTLIRLCLDDEVAVIEMLENAKLVPADAVANGYDYRETA
jgi:hypothetical protein